MTNEEAVAVRNRALAVCKAALEAPKDLETLITVETAVLGTLAQVLVELVAQGNRGTNDLS